MDECVMMEAEEPKYTSFAQMLEAEQAQMTAMKVGRLSSMMPQMVANILEDETIEDKEAAISALAGEFATLTQEAMKQKSVWQPLTDKLVNTVKDITKALTKREGGVDYPMADFAYTPDPEKPSTWKLRLTESPGEVTVAQLGRAAAAFSSGGFRGNRVQIPQSDMAGVKAKIRAAYTKLGTKRQDMPDSVKEQSFSIWHDKETDQYRWFAIYSNKFRDNDIPPEIISDASHRQFVKEVEAGLAPYPELWLWHIPGSRAGQADWLTYTDEGFALASGYFDTPQIAKGLMEYDGELLVSHGMPPQFIERDSHDKSVITHHITREISPLPARMAANKLTGFELLRKEETMSIPQDKKEFLKSVGMSDEDIANIESRVKETATKAEGLEFKEVEQSDLIKAMEAMVKPLVDKITALEAEVKSLKQDDETKVKETIANTPKSSLEALAAKSIETLFSNSTKVDGRQSIAKNGPAENKTKSQQGLFFQNWMMPAQEETNA